jgi:hypothetical protein
MSRLRTAAILGTVLLAGLFLFLSWRNSVVVTAVSIQVRDGIKEHTDHTLLGIGAEHHLPDYRVKLRVNRRLLAMDLGTKLNTSATNWLEYPVQDIVPLRRIQEVIIIEDDKVENDTLERLQIAGTEATGTQFLCRLTTTRSFEAGMNWFFATPVGKAVAAGIVIGLVVLVGSLLRR